MYESYFFLQELFIKVELDHSKELHLFILDTVLNSILLAILFSM